MDCSMCSLDVEWAFNEPAFYYGSSLKEPCESIEV